jgi:hypothetical protein
VAARHWGVRATGCTRPRVEGMRLLGNCERRGSDRGGAVLAGFGQSCEANPGDKSTHLREHPPTSSATPPNQPPPLLHPLFNLPRCRYVNWNNRISQKPSLTSHVQISSTVYKQASPRAPRPTSKANFLPQRPLPEKHHYVGDRLRVRLRHATVR